jgi:hypothetical protein
MALITGRFPVTLDEALSRATISVPEAGQVFFEIRRNASYEAAKRGDLPVIKVGGIYRVPVAPLAERLGLKTTFGPSRS